MRSRETARLLVSTHDADYLMTTLDWERDATGHFQEPVARPTGASSNAPSTS